MTDSIDEFDNGNDQQLGEEGMHHVRSQLALVLAEMDAEEVRCRNTEPADDGLLDAQN